jgi:hypothetical protein
MAIKAGVGMSRHHNPNVAGREAGEQALESAGVDKPDFVFMFASIGYDQHSLVQAVRESTGGAPLCGCSVEGTIAAEDADESNFSVVVLVISSEELQWRNGLAKGVRADSHAVGQRVAQELLPDLSPSTIGLFVFPDGMSVALDSFFAANFDNFFAGLEENQLHQGRRVRYPRHTCSEDGRRIHHRADRRPGGHEHLVLKPRQAESRYRARSDGRSDQGAARG